MFLTIQTKSHQNEWVSYVLTGPDGNAFHADLVKFTELTILANAPMPPEFETVTLTIVDRDTDWQKLYNRTIILFEQPNMAAMKWKIYEAGQRLLGMGKTTARAIICNETGQTWNSATQCANAHGLTYSQLLGHLNGTRGHKTVKGRTYRRLT